jgi:hypothetical protein
MSCLGFTGGIGTSSRVVTLAGKEYVVGVLVQANHGVRGDLRVDGYPVGRYLGNDVVPEAVIPPEDLVAPEPGMGSIIIVIATNASRTTPTECVFVRPIGVVSRPLSRTHSRPVNSPLPLRVAVPAVTGVARACPGTGLMTVTPVRPGPMPISSGPSPSTSVV